MTDLSGAISEFLPAIEGACWEWPEGMRSQDGYGRTWHEGRHRVAHRVSYEALMGTIPDGLQLDHLCRNRACVNPWHLEPVTPQENWWRGRAPSKFQALRTHCDHGHEFTPENTILAKRKKGRRVRVCRQCKKHWQERYEKGLTNTPTPEQEERIRNLLATTTMTQREIAAEVGTTQKIVWRRARGIDRPE